MPEPTRTTTSNVTGPDDAPAKEHHGDALLDRVPQEPVQPDESGSGTASGTTGGYREERTSGGSDASGLPVDDEARGEKRRQRYEEGSTEVSSLD
jgi:hypothetical protein